MKATGIVRRIDDLGRVVIPKEIRRTMRIREGDPLEIYTDREGEVIFKKYSPIGELASFAAQYAETLQKTCGMAVIITDRDAVIAAAGVSKKEYLERKISEELEDIIETRGLYTHRAGQERYRVTEDGGAHYVSCAMPILADGDVIGAVCSVLHNEDSEGKLSDDIEVKLIQTAAGFLGKQMEG
jgi:AbrB family transcriptional regulator (stage V sporulation protein T)